MLTNKITSIKLTIIVLIINTECNKRNKYRMQSLHVVCVVPKREIKYTQCKHCKQTHRYKTD